MAEIYNIHDEMAFSHDCGSVKFNLLKSGSIECDGCQQKTNMNWSEKMDSSKVAELSGLEKLNQDIGEATANEIEKAKVTVINAVKSNGGYAYWSTIKRFAGGGDSDSALSKALNALLKEKKLRQKEDEIEHDWEYRLVRS